MYERSRENLDRLITAFERIGHTCAELRKVALSLGSHHVAAGPELHADYVPGAIDLLGEIPGGGSYLDLATGAIALEIFGTRCLCLSLSQLISAKRAAGRPKDLEVLAELAAIQEMGENEFGPS